MQEQKLFQVTKPGVLTSFQDLGRTGYQQYGVPVSGAMDQVALQIANILTGNPRGTACLEVTLIGPELVVTSPTPITAAITGASLEPKRNSKPLPMWQSVRLYPGDRLTFGRHQAGVRAYIAVAGGFQAPEYFQSKSTDVKSGFGRPLEKGQSITGFPINAKPGIGLTSAERPVYNKSITVSVIEGPHTGAFTQEGLDRFYNTIHIVDANSNRMGYKLISKPITQKDGVSIWSDAVPFGGIQVPKNGAPIILMADRQTTGGYPRIGTVMTADLPKLAQLVPKGEIRFQPIPVEAAQEHTRQLETYLHNLETFYQNGIC
ncbi:biotin-dependent carboxyltransferase [Lentibacillus lipolyticus]|nr:biotin-dependent carboxyltransferase [Lentibacillus lipolyticus]